MCSEEKADAGQTLQNHMLTRKEYQSLNKSDLTRTKDSMIKEREKEYFFFTWNLRINFVEKISSQRGVKSMKSHMKVGQNWWEKGVNFQRESSSIFPIRSSTPQNY